MGTDDNTNRRVTRLVLSVRILEEIKLHFQRILLTKTDKYFIHVKTDKMLSNADYVRRA